MIDDYEYKDYSWYWCAIVLAISMDQLNIFAQEIVCIAKEDDVITDKKRMIAIVVVQLFFYLNLWMQIAVCS